MRRRRHRPEPPSSHAYGLETVRAVHDACLWDLEHEIERARVLDGKLTQLAAFSGVSISITAAFGGAMLADGRLSSGFTIALGACIVLASLLLLGGVASAFAALAPQQFSAVDSEEVTGRTVPSALRSDPSIALARFAATRRDMLRDARAINDRKASGTARTFWLVASGLGALVGAIAVMVVGSVV